MTTDDVNRADRVGVNQRNRIALIQENPVRQSRPWFNRFRQYYRTDFSPSLMLVFTRYRSHSLKMQPQYCCR